MFKIFQGKNVLVTGHTGFKGSWLVSWLTRLGANVAGFSDRIPTTPSHFVESGIATRISDHRGDVNDLEAVKKLISDFRPDFIFHLAAEALVGEAYENPQRAFQTNALGTVNVLEALRCVQSPTVCIFITSDKVYDNVEWIWGYREVDAIGGKDPYSASKGMAELAIKSYFSSFFNAPDSVVKIGVGRAGNVIGGGDWSANRLVPDCVKSWSQNEEVEIRNLDATRPWQHVLEPLSGYLALAESLSHGHTSNGEAFNFGPPAENDFSVRDLITSMQSYWNNVAFKDVAPSAILHHEAGLLKLNCDKAQSLLGWKASLSYSETVKLTMEWYKAFYEEDNLDVRALTDSQIDKYVCIAKNSGTTWAVK